MFRVLPAYFEMYRASDMSQDRGIIPLPLSPSPSWCVASWLNTYQTGTLFPARYNGAQDPSGGRARGRVHGQLCPWAAGPGSFTLANLLLLTFSLLAHSKFSFLGCTSFPPSINLWQFSLLGRCCPIASVVVADTSLPYLVLSRSILLIPIPSRVRRRAPPH